MATAFQSLRPSGDVINIISTWELLPYGRSLTRLDSIAVKKFDNTITILFQMRRW